MARTVISISYVVACFPLLLKLELYVRSSFYCNGYQWKLLHRLRHLSELRVSAGFEYLSRLGLPVKIDASYGSERLVALRPSGKDPSLAYWRRIRTPREHPRSVFHEPAMHSITGSDRPHCDDLHFDASLAHPRSDKGYPRNRLFLLAQGPAQDALNNRKNEIFGDLDGLGFQGYPALPEHQSATYDLACWRCICTPTARARWLRDEHTMPAIADQIIMKMHAPQSAGYPPIGGPIKGTHVKHFFCLCKVLLRL